MKKSILTQIIKEEVCKQKKSRLNEVSTDYRIYINHYNKVLDIINNMADTEQSDSVVQQINILWREYKQVIDDMDFAKGIEFVRQFQPDKRFNEIKKRYDEKIALLSQDIQPDQELEEPVSEPKTAEPTINQPSNTPTDTKQQIDKAIQELLNEVDPVKMSKNTSSKIEKYQDLLKKKQDIINSIKKLLSTEKDPIIKAEKIAKHNIVMKKLNTAIQKAEMEFTQAVDDIAAVEDEDSLLEGIGVPSNIEEFAKQKGVLSDVKQIARWIQKASDNKRKGIGGGTAIGKNYNTMVLDIEYQDSAIYFDTDKGTIELYGERISDYKSFKKVYDNHFNQQTQN